ncbi:MAG: ImmA/IrrE family metallo-endopeptidase [Acetobacteraceae bacterium]|nr:ImmA/IrrE family metallo-endopeptidase [Acetobacteraceae bacterium]
MTERLKAPVEPAVLAWGRKSAALSLAEAARKIGVDEARLEAWEAGTDAPTIPQLRKLATAYKRPLAVFFLPEPPNELGFSALRDFRRLRPDQRQPFSPQLAYEIRAAQERRAVALGVFETMGTAPPAFDLTARVSDDPETVARRVRETLGITLAQQTGWRDPAKGFRAWREAIEGAGVLVFVLGGAHHQVPLEEVRGFALADRPLPVIVVNGQDRPNGRTFTLLHELGHVLLGQTAIANDPEPDARLPAAARRIEVFCNRLAAAALMPRDALLAEPLLAAKQGQPAPWSDEEIEALANRYAVSREALLLRLVEVGRADQALYQSKRAEYERQYAAEAEAANEGGFAPYRYQVLSHLGRGFARLILQGYYQNRLSLSAVAGYLGVQAKHVPALEQAAFTRAS